MDLVGHDFLTLLDFTPAEIGYLLDLAAELKAKKRAGIPHDTLRGKNVALIFEKTSTRTRCSFEVAAHDLGMGTTYLDPTGSQIGKKESIADTAQVLSGMFEGIEYRGYGQAIVEELAKYASVPVWNGLTNEYHPTQILADFLTLREHFGKLQGLKFAYMGDARYNMGNSLMIGCAKMGLHFVACAPKAYWPDPALVEKCKEFARVSGGSITLTHQVRLRHYPCAVLFCDRQKDHPYERLCQKDAEDTCFRDRTCKAVPCRLSQPKGVLQMTNFNDFLNEQMKDPEFKAEWDALDPEFAVIEAILAARKESGLTQQQLSERTGIAQTDISKLERGNGNPSLRTLQRLAAGMGMRVKIEFVPAK